ncbi:hypothetical protein VTO42DRAFT_1449 [Malbranchea cinnamomea]
MEEIRSPSSSPDPLEYPGDPKFLLSSATKSIPRRFSFSPRKSQTPRPPSQRPRKKGSTIKPLKFSDMVLPATPSRGSRARTSASPSKTTMQSEGNVSPWRIRVTVEAEREDEEGEGGGRTGVTPWANATTTKVPLKGTSSAEPTPKRRKTPRRKSVVSGRVATPGRRKSLPPVEDGNSGTAEKRKRGRPRKTIQPSAAEEEAQTQPVGGSIRFSNDGDPFLDIAMERDFRGDSLTNGQDSRPFVDVIDTAVSDQSSVDGGSPRHPTRDQMPEASQTNGDLNLGANDPQSSPPQRQEGSSPGNTLHAGRTPRPKFRQYLTPTSSSVLGDNGVENSVGPSPSKGKILVNPKIRRSRDPTEVHREFDTILEGEDFSMVSLSTLPSAKQQLSGAARAGLSAASAALSASQQSHNTSRKRKQSELTAESSQAVSESQHIQTHYSAGEVLYPSLPNPGRPESQIEISTGDKTWPLSRDPVPRRKPLARLVRMIRLGLTLQRLLNRNRESSLTLDAGTFRRSNKPDDEPEAIKQRLEQLFSDFNTDVKKDLSAGLLFGVELAKRLQRIDERRRKNREAMLVASNKIDNESELSSEIGPPPKITSPSAYSLAGRTPVARPGEGNNLTLEERRELEMSRRRVDWQREREAVSRQIEAANADQVIVIDGDDENSLPGSRTSNRREVETHKTQEEFAYDEEVYAEPQEKEEEEVYEDDDYEDIWQQEARQTAESSLQGSIQPRLTKLRRWKVEDDVGHSEYGETRHSVDWPAPRSEFSMPSGAKTQVAKYRDGDLETSSLLGTPETATRRFYEGEFVSPSHPPPPRDGLQSTRPLRVQHMGDPISYSRLSQTPESGRHSVADNYPIEQQTPEYPADDEHDLRADGERSNLAEQSPPVEAHNLHHSEGFPTPSRLGTDVPGEDTPRKVFSPAERSEYTSPKNQNARAASHARHPGRQESSRSSWFNKLTAFAPAWLTAKFSQVAGSARGRHPSPGAQPQAHAANTPLSPTSQEGTAGDLPSSPPTLRHKPPPRKSASPRKPLALGGYFTDDHYEALYRLYRQAKQNPDLFPYEPTPERDWMLGRTMSTEDGSYPRQVTEIQIAIAARFLQDLVDASRRRGGSDKLEWTELDIVWRLWSIIVGGQIRRERKLALRAARKANS